MVDSLTELRNLLDHIELVNWIHYMSYHAAKVGTETTNLDGREFIQLPSGKKVKITIKIEDYKCIQ